MSSSRQHHWRTKENRKRKNKDEDECVRLLSNKFDVNDVHRLVSCLSFLQLEDPPARYKVFIWLKSFHLITLFSFFDFDNRRATSFRVSIDMSNSFPKCSAKQSKTGNDEIFSSMLIVINFAKLRWIYTKRKMFNWKMDRWTRSLPVIWSRHSDKNDDFLNIELERRESRREIDDCSTSDE